jgi:recombination protein RecR
MKDGLPESLVRLTGELRKLPGVGEKTALRYVLHMLSGGMDRMTALSDALAQVIDTVRPCAQCGFPAEGDLCSYCSDPARDRRSICVVESVGDLLAVERMGEFNGIYHILGGSVSALRGITPEKLRIPEFAERVQRECIGEVIVATGADAEGETTALYIRKILEGRGLDVRVTRPATGIPMGSSIEYLDGVTLMRALRARREL